MILLYSKRLKKEIDLSLLKEEFVDIAMSPQTVVLKEVVVSAVNPESAINDMLNNRANNYATEPVHLTTFYREGIDHNNINIDLSESVLQIYKTGHKKNTCNLNDVIIVNVTAQFANYFS